MDAGGHRQVVAGEVARVIAQPVGAIFPIAGGERLGKAAGHDALPQITTSAGCHEIGEVGGKGPVKEVCRLASADLGNRKRQQLNRHHPSGQRVRGDGAFEQLHRAGDQVAAALRAVVDEPLDLENQIGCPLDFVDYAGWHVADKCSRVSLGKSARAGGIETDIRQVIVPGNLFDQGGLAGLPGTGERDHPIALHRIGNLLPGMAGQISA